MIGGIAALLLLGLMEALFLGGCNLNTKTENSPRTATQKRTTFIIMRMTIIHDEY